MDRRMASSQTAAYVDRYETALTRFSSRLANGCDRQSGGIGISS
jgi:hypothetical protein